MSTREETFLDVIERTASKFKLPIGLVRAICKTESDFIPTAVRWEPAFYHKYIKPRIDHENPKLNIPFEEAIGNACSFGLMQIMGSTARSMGYDGDLTGLWQPIINLNYCCKFLNKLIKRYSGNFFHAIAAYNAGSPRYQSDGSYVNQGYVDKVCRSWKAYNKGEFEDALSTGESNPASDVEAGSPEA